MGHGTLDEPDQWGDQRATVHTYPHLDVRDRASVLLRAPGRPTRLHHARLRGAESPLPAPAFWTRRALRPRSRQGCVLSTAPLIRGVSVVPRFAQGSQEISELLP